MKIGIGYDTHQLVSERKLILGGIEIPFEKGSLGHSDGDVLVHAICDALLGAIGLRDIGYHFPDTDDRYRDISSLSLLESIINMMEERGYTLGNVDATVVLQKPKIASYINEMIEKLSQALHTDTERINIKATTSEGMGFEGEGKGISSYAIVLLHT